MADLPPCHLLVDVDRAVIFGLMSMHGAPATEASYEFAWQRDQALLDAVDNALRDAAKGKGAEVTPQPGWLEGLRPVRRRRHRRRPVCCAVGPGSLGRTSTTSVRPTNEQTPGCRGYTGGQPDSRAVQQGAQVLAASSMGVAKLRRPCGRLRRSWACF